jgi:DNA invertase Pin-like site-specific DNA recombinase
MERPALLWAEETEVTKRLRCAIYTRKSSEEGLDQEYNSLDAQRDACEAYIISQKGEGWTASAKRYDDGGWSGGSMERPGLKALLADIEAGHVEVIVVYKVDRLTRSLSDFARMVELLDRREVSFVSVTQAFNTTSSMGRLTLNVLLSFAQFEREVTGERIRDKIAASKARGMWMGGYPPLGYDPKDRSLVVNEGEAELVRHIFSRYLQLGSVHALTRELASRGVLSKRWTSGAGHVRGGTQFSRGAIFHLLRNRIYLGEIVHKGNSHPGQHARILDRALFDAVQEKLSRGVGTRKARTSARAPLSGLIFDAQGNRMSPVHTRNRHGRSYRYYVSAPLLTGGSTEGGTLRRVSAPAIEEALLARMRQWTGRSDAVFSTLRSFISRVTVHDDHILVDLSMPDLETWTANILQPDRCTLEGGALRIRSPLKLCVRGGKTFAEGDHQKVRRHPDRALVAGLKRAHAELRVRGISIGERTAVSEAAKGIDDPYLRKLAKLAFLAPDIQQAILSGSQPAGMSLAQLLSTRVPLDWALQRQLLGFAQEQVLQST